MNFLGKLQKFDWVLFVACSALVIFGLVSLYSSSFGGDYSNFYRQLIFFIISILIMFGMSFMDNRILRENPLILISLYFVCILLLIGVFFFAPEIRGIKSWYRIGPVSFDPIEPMKIIIILILAKYFSHRHIELYNLKHIFISGLYLILPIILIFLQPEFGSVAVLLAIWIGMLLVSGIKIRDFIILVLIFTILTGTVWQFLLKDYQKQRVLSFVAPQEDLQGTGWSQNQSKISIGSGGLLGMGIGKGPQTQYGFLPEAHTDFVFSAIAEETGFLGASILFSLFAIIFWRIFKIAFSVNSNFSRLFASGLAIAIFFHMTINIGMNLGVLPVIGLPLPLVSYGGSNLFFNFLALGILQNMRMTDT